MTTYALYDTDCESALTHWGSRRYIIREAQVRRASVFPWLRTEHALRTLGDMQDHARAIWFDGKPAELLGRGWSDDEPAVLKLAIGKTITLDMLRRKLVNMCGFYSARDLMEELYGDRNAGMR